MKSRGATSPPTSPAIEGLDRAHRTHRPKSRPAEVGLAAGSIASIAVLAVLAASLLPSGTSAQVYVQTQPAPPAGQSDPQPYPQQYEYAQPGEAQIQYVYVPASVDQQRVAMLNARMIELRTLRSQYRVGGPIAMIAIGSAVTAISALAAMGFGLARSVSSDDYGPDGTNLVRGSRVAGAFALGGIVMVGIGGTKLSQRLRLRRQWDPEIFRIRDELRMLRLNGVGLRLAPDFAGAEARFSF